MLLDNMQAFVHMSNGQFCTHIHLVVDFRFEAVTRRLAILRHHQNRGLYGREHRQNQIEKNVGIRIESRVAWTENFGIEDCP